MIRAAPRQFSPPPLLHSSLVGTDTPRRWLFELTGVLKDNLSKVVQHGKRADSIVKKLLHSRELRRTPIC
jgi:hypothetical protein